MISPPSGHQISPSLEYINPFLQVFGGERFGIDIKNDIGISFGLGTPYSGAGESDFVEANFHILGFKAGMFGSFNELVAFNIHGNDKNQHTMLFSTKGLQVSYVIPLGNFFEFGYQKSYEKLSDYKINLYESFDTLGFSPNVIDGEYINWEFRYPVRILSSTRSKFYAARYLNEYHFGFTGRELSFSGSTFDFRFDAMPVSEMRPPQYLVDIMVQKIFGGWGFSSLALGPSVVFSTNKKGEFGLTSLLFNARLKVGTSF
jgi:hypothetical protein